MSRASNQERAACTRVSFLVTGETLKYKIIPTMSAVSAHEALKLMRKDLRTMGYIGAQHLFPSEIGTFSMLEPLFVSTQEEPELDPTDRAWIRQEPLLGWFRWLQETDKEGREAHYALWKANLNARILVQHPTLVSSLCPY